MALEILKITELVLGCSGVEQMKCPRKWERPENLSTLRLHDFLNFSDLRVTT